MLIEAPTGTGASVSARLELSGRPPAELRWELPHEPGPAHVDALLPAALPLAMWLKEPLRIGAPVSPRLLRSADTVQDIFACWGELGGIEAGVEPMFERVPVEAPERVEPAPAGDGVAAFFTAGVDSFYTALRHRDELSALVYVHGFDVPIDDAELRERVACGVRKAAGMLGLPLVEVEADVRGVSDPLIPWLDYHGAALASVALLLADRFRRVYVPSTMTYATLLPLGSHPLLDPLWSSERMELVHDGCGATRRHKLTVLAECEAARRWLRVCWENRAGAYNCGRCEKCLRTLVELRLAGLIDRFESFPEFDVGEVENAPLEFGGMGWRAAFHSARQAGRDPELTAALRRALRRTRLEPSRTGEGRPTASEDRAPHVELFAAATATAMERDRLRRRVVELEDRLAAMESTAAWRAASTAQTARDRLRERMARGSWAPG